MIYGVSLQIFIAAMFHSNTSSNIFSIIVIVDCRITVIVKILHMLRSLLIGVDFCHSMHACMGPLVIIWGHEVVYRFFSDPKMLDIE